MLKTLKADSRFDSAIQTPSAIEGLPVTTTAAWAALCAKHQRTGRLLSSFDSLLAATATIHGLTMVTRNHSDFPPELSLVNPWIHR